MDLTFVVNDVDELTLDMSTVLLIQRAALSHEVRVLGVSDLAVDPADRVFGRARRATPGSLDEDWLAGLRGGEPEATVLSEQGLVWLRTNPARDPLRARAHNAALALGQLLVHQGVPVINDPAGLLRAASKLYLSYLPAEVRPRTLVSSDRTQLKRFVREQQEAVLKPLAGTHGQRVFRVSAKSPNLSAILDAVLLDGPAMAQELADEAELGDVRLLMVNGDLLEVGGEAAAVRRVPGAGEFRSNVHAGGRPELAVVDDRLRRVAASVGPRLRTDGIFFAGLDVIGGKVIEVNAYSPGGLGDASLFTGVDFTGAVVDAAVGMHART